jgi:hypothetical protein
MLWRRFDVAPRHAQGRRLTTPVIFRLEKELSL